MLVGQHHRNPTANRRHQRIGGAEIDADRPPMLMRRRRLAWLGDLKQRH